MKIGSKIIAKVGIKFASPAQGAVFAPLALKFVHSGPYVFFIPDYDPPHRAPVMTINANGTTTQTNLPSESPKIQNRNMGAIVGGSVAAIFVVIGTVSFVKLRRRWRRSRPRSILPTDPVSVGPQLIVSPFDRNSFDQYTENLAEQRPLRIGEQEVAMVAPNRLSSSPPPILPLLPPVASVPVGLTDKEMARLRSEAFSSPEPRNFQVSASNVSRSTSPPSLNIVTESGESPYHNRRLHSEVESLRREVEQLRAEGLVVGAPPSYAEGDG